MFEYFTCDAGDRKIWKLEPKAGLGLVSLFANVAVSFDNLIEEMFMLRKERRFFIDYVASLHV